MCWILSAAVSWRDLSHENNIFSPLDFCAELQHSYNCSPLWADILKPNFREFLSPPFDKFKFKILLECLEKNSAIYFCRLCFVVYWLWLAFIENSMLHFVLMLRNYIENIFGILLGKCDLIQKVLPMKIWKILQLTKSDKGNRLELKVTETTLSFKSYQLCHSWHDFNWFGFILFSWLPLEKCI